MFLSRDNQKVGDGAWTWSIPAVKTCPGSTPTCRSSCYARTHRFRFASVQTRYSANLRLARSPDFWAMMLGAIRFNNVNLLRIHSSGDFFNAAYVRQWIRIAKMCPDVTFWAYTRSWRRPAFRRALARLAALPNVTLYYSCDRDTGVPETLPERVRTAYLQTDHEDVPARPVDLVFRTQRLRKKKAKVIRTPEAVSPVCPTETGYARAHDVHCATCQKCFTPPVSGRIPLPQL